MVTRKDPPKQTRKPMNVTIHPDAKEMLHEMSHDDRLSMSAWLETLIRREWSRRHPKTP